MKLILGFASSINDAPSVYAQAAALGSTCIRLDLPWKLIETTPGVYELPASLDAQLTAITDAGMSIIGILAYGNPLYANGAKPRDDATRAAFAQYAKQTVKLLKGRVKTFEIWNEWETACGGDVAGSPEDYLALARVVMPVVRAANPYARYISAGMSDPATNTDYYQRFLNGGGVDLFDGLSFHPYGVSMSRGITPEARMVDVDKWHAMALTASGGVAVDFYITEMGYSSYYSGGTPADGVADFLTRFTHLADSRTWIKGVTWYCLRDQGVSGTDKEQNFGAYDFRMNMKPAALAFQTAAAGLMATRGVVTQTGTTYTYKNNGGTCSWQATCPVYAP